MDQLITQDPTRIGPYRLIARLGAGGMGLVYLGRSEGGRTVAVKVVQAEYAGNPDFRKRFAREVAAARRVGGSWTAAVLDADPEAAVPWVATQYIPGPDLHSVVAKDFGPLPEHSVHTLANRLSLALQAVHEAGLIHRDLKPSNVLVTVDGPRVIDFGIARAMDSLAGDSLLTNTGMLIGSPGFMSPEQVRGLELTPASDVFCLGAVLVYAATGRLLFGAADTGLNAHLFRVAEEEADLTGVPDALAGLVGECLHKDPARRPTPRQVAERTATDPAGEWLPGTVLAQLGRHAAQLLDFAPATPDEAPAAPSDPRVPPARSAPGPLPPPPEYAPTTPAHHDPARGFGPPQDPPQGPPPAAWPAVPTATPAAAALQDSASPHSRRWLGLAVAALVQLLVGIEAMVFNSSMSAVHAFGLSGEDMGLLFTAYLVTFAALLLPGGYLADRLGRRRTLIIGLAGFSAACVIGGSLGGDGLVWARGLQGAFGALLTPAAFALVPAGFTDPRQRAKAFGLYTALTGAGSALWLLCSGLLQGFSWQMAMYAPVLLAVVPLICVLALPRDRPGPDAARHDVPGLLLGAGGLGALTYGFAVVGQRDWTDVAALVALAIGAILSVAFLVRRSTTAGPLTAPSAVKDRNRLGGLLALLLSGVGTVILFSALNYYLLYVLDYGQAMAGTLLLPMTAALAIGATQVSARLAHRWAPGVLIAAGLVLTAGGLVLLTGLENGADYVPGVLPGTLLTGLGLGIALMPMYTAVTGGVGARHAGGASAVILSAQQLGEAVGGVVLGVAFDFYLDMSSGSGVNGRLLGAYTVSLWAAFGAVLLGALIAGPMVTGRADRGGVRQPSELLR
ncbi:MDR family MFS transporter [Streptomyces sp. NPDC054956]